jgi:hypothetical protein
MGDEYAIRDMECRGTEAWDVTRREAHESAQDSARGVSRDVTEETEHHNWWDIGRHCWRDMSCQGTWGKGNDLYHHIIYWVVYIMHVYIYIYEKVISPYKSEWNQTGYTHTFRPTSLFQILTQNAPTLSVSFLSHT